MATRNTERELFCTLLPFEYSNLYKLSSHGKDQGYVKLLSTFHWPCETSQVLNKHLKMRSTCLGVVTDQKLNWKLQIDDGLCKKFDWEIKLFEKKF